MDDIDIAVMVVTVDELAIIIPVVVKLAIEVVVPNDNK